MANKRIGAIIKAILRIFSAFRSTEAIARSTISPSKVVSTATSVLLLPPFNTVLSETCLFIFCTVAINSAASFNCSTNEASFFSSLDRLTMPSSKRSSKTASLVLPVASAIICAFSSNSACSSISSLLKLPASQ